MSPTRDGLLLLLAVLASGLALLLSLVVAWRARTPVRRRVARALAVLLAPAWAVLTWGRLVEPQWVAVTRASVTWAGPPLRIAVLGDFHAGRIGADVIARAVRLSNAAEPDVVLLAGDYVTGYDLSAPKARILEALRPLRARLGVFAVLGNHDSEPYGTDTPRAGDIARHLSSMGFTVLRNRWQEIAPGVVLIGLDEVQSRNIDPVLAFRGAPEGARILLTHDWHGLYEPGVGRFDLGVAAHTHGGQICVPFTTWCPFGKNITPYLGGMYDWPGGGKLFVTRGIGESAVLLRIGSRPEVAVIEAGPGPR
jgi:hypothetical protein